MLYDKDIREPLFDYLDEKYWQNRIFEEMPIGKSRADAMMVFGNSIYGIEIKSDADTYSRLKRQVKDYNRFFDYNYVVVGSTHALNVSEHVPDYWGIISVEMYGGKVDFYEVRKPAANPKRERTVLLRNQVSLLWRPELAHIQELNGLPKYRQLSKANLILKIMEKVPEDILKKQISDELMERDYTTIAKRIEQYKSSAGLFDK